MAEANEEWFVVAEECHGRFSKGGIFHCIEYPNRKRVVGAGPIDIAMRCCH